MSLKWPGASRESKSAAIRMGSWPDSKSDPDGVAIRAGTELYRIYSSVSISSMHM